MSNLLKTCTCCLVAKPLSDFYSKADHRLRVKATCKICDNASRQGRRDAKLIAGNTASTAQLIAAMRQTRSRVDALRLAKILALKQAQSAYITAPGP